MAHISILNGIFEKKEKNAISDIFQLFDKINDLISSNDHLKHSIREIQYL